MGAHNRCWSLDIHIFHDKDMRRGLSAQIHGIHSTRFPSTVKIHHHSCLNCTNMILSVNISHSLERKYINFTHLCLRSLQQWSQHRNLKVQRVRYVKLPRLAVALNEHRHRHRSHDILHLLAARSLDANKTRISE